MSKEARQGGEILFLKTAIERLDADNERLIRYIQSQEESRQSVEQFSREKSELIDRLRAAIEKHKADMWGQDEVGDELDRALYAVLGGGDEHRGSVVSEQTGCGPNRPEEEAQ